MTSTVQDLIDALEKCPRTAEVVIFGTDEKLVTINEIVIAPTNEDGSKVIDQEYITDETTFYCFNLRGNIMKHYETLYSY